VKHREQITSLAVLVLTGDAGPDVRLLFFRMKTTVSIDPRKILRAGTFFCRVLPADDGRPALAKKEKGARQTTKCRVSLNRVLFTRKNDFLGNHQAMTYNITSTN